MDTISNGCRLCLDSFAESFTTLDNPQLKRQIQNVFCFAIEPKQGYSSSVCQSCSYAISEFYHYSEKVRQNQEILNGNVTNYDSTLDSTITLESVKVETLSDSEHPETIEDACEPKDEISGVEVPISGDDESKEPNIKREDESTNPDEHIDTGVLRCELCENKYKSQDNLDKHMIRNHPISRPFSCDHCPETFALKYELVKHMEWHVKVKCNEMFNGKLPSSLQMPNQQSGTDRTMVCDNTGKEALTEQRFDRHMNKHMGTEDQRVQCGICQRWLKNKGTLRTHMKSIHGDGGRQFQCDICQQQYAHARALHIHKLQTHGEPKHECEFCGKKFKRAMSLKVHRISHTGDIEWAACKICQRWFRNKETLQNHMICAHNDDSSREFQCNICPQKYPNSKALFLHKFRAHTELKYVCQFCGKKFPKAVTLKEHLTVHTS